MRHSGTNDSRVARITRQDPGVRGMGLRQPDHAHVASLPVFTGLLIPVIGLWLFALGGCGASDHQSLGRPTLICWEGLVVNPSGEVHARSRTYLGSYSGALQAASLPLADGAERTSSEPATAPCCIEPRRSDQRASFQSLREFHCARDGAPQEFVDEVHLRRIDAETWTYVRIGYVGGFRFSRLDDSALVAERHAGADDFCLLMQLKVPGEVIGGNAHAECGSGCVGWVVRGSRGRPSAYRNEVSFRSRAPLVEFSLGEADFLQGCDGAVAPAAALGPLDGQGWREPVPMIRPELSKAGFPSRSARDGGPLVVRVAGAARDPERPLHVCLRHVSGDGALLWSNKQTLADEELQVHGVMPGEYEVSLVSGVRRIDFGVRSVESRPGRGSVLNLEVGALESGVVVTDWLGRPVVGFEVVARREGTGTSLSGAMAWRSVTDVNGLAELRDMLPGRYAFGAQGEFVCSHEQSDDVRASGRSVRIELKPEDCAILDVSVLDARGQRSPAVIRVLREGGQSDLVVDTARDGSRRFYMPSGSYSVGLFRRDVVPGMDPRFAAYATRMGLVKGETKSIVLQKP